MRPSHTLRAAVASTSRTGHHPQRPRPPPLVRPPGYEIVGYLAPYKVPARFEPIGALPRNEVGKVLARDLVARIATDATDPIGPPP